MTVRGCVYVFIFIAKPKLNLIENGGKNQANRITNLKLPAF
jgi:hypothetical protein